MAFDGIVTAAIAAQLTDKLQNGKIEKIYQPEAEELVFYVHSSKGNFKLYISVASSHARIHLASETFSNPQSPMAFCMLLRKHLQGGRISRVSQHGSERIIEFEIETLNELGFSVSKKMIVEIMGKHSNVSVVETETGKIIDSIKRVSIDVNRVRQILPGKHYEYPPTQKKIPFKTVSLSDLERITCCLPDRLRKDLLDGISGISPAFADTLAFNCEGLHPADAAVTVLKQLGEIRRALDSGQCSPVVYFSEDGTPFDFHVFPLELEAYCDKKTFASPSEAVEYYYLNKTTANRVRQKTSDLDRAIKASLDKLYLKKQRLMEDLMKAENCEDLRLYGELITANIHLVHPGAASVTVTNYYDGSQLTIPLDIRYSAAKNAQLYFKKYGKSKTALKEKNIQLEETNVDIAYLESVASFAENASTVEEAEEIRAELVEGGYLRKRKNNYSIKKSKAAPITYQTSDGIKIMVGKNNKENDILTFKTAGPKDVWFHTKDIPGSHVIVFADGRQLSEKAIFEAAAIAAYHSKGRNSDNVPVDYVRVRHVKKPSGAKPGMVIFTNNKTVYVKPDLPKPDSN